MKTMILTAMTAAALLVGVSATASPYRLQTQNMQSVNAHAIAQGITSVAQLSKLPDDSMVRLKGKIVRALYDDNYEFSDGTGTVVVEIDHELWQGRPLNTNQTITLVGELDKEWHASQHISVDVDYIEF